MLTVHFGELTAVAALQGLQQSGVRCAPYRQGSFFPEPNPLDGVQYLCGLSSLPDIPDMGNLDTAWIPLHVLLVSTVSR
jgi:hypothetical protein